MKKPRRSPTTISAPDPPPAPKWLPDVSQVLAPFPSVRMPPSTDARLREAVREWHIAQDEDLQSALSVCESPMERLLFLGFITTPLPMAGGLVQQHARSLTRWHAQQVGVSQEAKALLGNEKWFLYCQFPVTLRDRDIRLDFALFSSRSGMKIDVEVDGHDFHERTKEQAQSDKSRDRLLQSMGWQVLRYTGSEVWRDAASCAFEVLIHLGKGETDSAIPPASNPLTEEQENVLLREAERAAKIKRGLPT